MKKLMLAMATLLFSTFTLAQAVWVDVRSDEEYAQDHIKGDIQIPHVQIVEELGKLYPDKNTEIHLYCRSGRRAGLALEALQEAGYTNVQNAGGIDDARQERKLNTDISSQP
ncbi:rhodanese-like domain-containing protein [Neptunicella marina]|uniref:Rhodanese-like domain-containing protein n=1 Tax=Neptunicella marina TaxID=2125989 RepID=A0A8J6IWR5_9ALTE|nr:rhodanese-like domain-containing protein [Neptunicella marina]MBC3767102.1 rhodanese-like domain-containing protein [Neptunicella marina]